VAAAHAAGLVALSGIDGTSPAAPLPAQAPAVMVQFITPTAPPPAAHTETAPPASVADVPAQAPPTPPRERRPAVRPKVARLPDAPARPQPPVTAMKEPAAAAPATPAPPPTPAEPQADGPATPAPQPTAPPNLALAAPPGRTAPDGDPLATITASADPAYLNNPPPAYPRLSRRRGEEGQVILRVRVLRDGRPDAVEVAESSSHPRLDEAAREAVRGWRFVPARRGETTVDSWLRVPIVFRLEE
jgi:protein TonB